MAWIEQNGVRGWYDENTKTFVPKDRLSELRKQNPAAYANAGEDTGDSTYKQGQLVKQTDGSYAKWNANAGSFVPASNEEVAAFTNPSTSSAVNAGANPRRTDLDSAIVPYIQLGRVDPTTGKNSYNEEVARAEAEIKNPTGMRAQNISIEEAIKNLGGSEAEKVMMSEIQRLIASGGREVADSSYRDAKLEFESDAQRLRDKQAAELASRGLGMSTVVNDVQSDTNRTLAEQLQGAFYKSQLLGRTAADQAMGRGVELAKNMDPTERASALSGMGINQANIYSGASNRLNALNQQSEANALLNYGLQDAANDKSVGNVKYLLNLPYATNEAGNQASSNATSASNTQYQGLMNAYNTQQEGIGKLLGGVLTNALGKK